jgi:hypothetical protein
VATTRKEEISNSSSYLFQSMFTEIYTQIMDYSIINKVDTYKVLRDSFQEHAYHSIFHFVTPYVTLSWPSPLHTALYVIRLSPRNKITCICMSNIFVFVFVVGVFAFGDPGVEGLAQFLLLLDS